MTEQSGPKQLVQYAVGAEATGFDFAASSDHFFPWLDSVKPFWEAGFTDIALVQIGDTTQQQFLEEAARPLLAKLRAAAPTAS